MALYPSINKTRHAPTLAVGSLLGFIYVNYVNIDYEKTIINICKEIYPVLNDPDCSIEITRGSDRSIAGGILFSTIRLGRKRGIKPDSLREFLDLSKAPLLEEKIKIFTYDIPTPEHPKDIR